MAKKQGNNQDNKAAELIESPLQYTGSLDIDKNDIIAVAVTQAEDHMNLQLSQLQESVKETSKEVDELKQRIHESRISILKKEMSKKADAICKQLDKLGMDCDVNYVTYDRVLGYSTKDRLDALSQREMFSGSVIIEVAEKGTYGEAGDALLLTRCGSQQLKFDVVLQVDKPTQLAIGRLGELEEELKEKRAECLKWKRRLSQVPALERKYKARLAQARLGKTEKGREILERLTGTISEDVLALPST